MGGSARPTAATAGKGLKANQVSLKGDVWSGAGQHVPDEEAVGSGDGVEAASSGSAGCSRTKGSGSPGTSAADILLLDDSELAAHHTNQAALCLSSIHCHVAPHRAETARIYCLASPGLAVAALLISSSLSR